MNPRKIGIRFAFSLWLALSLVAVMGVYAAVAVADDVESAASDSDDASKNTTQAVSYYRDVRPILVENCQGCHQPARPLGGLVVTGVEGLLRGGESEEPAVVAGEPDESPLVHQITPLDGDPPAMPQDADPLAAAQIALIRDWIAAGAVDDSPTETRATYDAEHPPVYARAPVLTAVDYSPDGSLLAVSGYHEVLLHAPDGSSIFGRLVGLSERIESLEFSPDGSLLAVTGGSPGRFGEVQVWSVVERGLLVSLPVTYDSVFGASWSHDGTRVAFGCTDNTVRAVEALTGRQVLYQGAHEDWVLDTVWSKDSSHLISVSRDRSMKLTEVATEQFVDNITSITPGALKGGLMAVDRRPGEDHLLVGGADGTPKLYQTYRTMDRKIGDDYNLLRAYEAVPGRIFAVRFNHDGSRFAVGSSHDGRGEVRVYQTDDGKLLSRLEIEGGVYGVAFRPDGAQLASVGFDGMVRLSDPETGELVTQFVAVPLSGDGVAAAP